MAYYRCTGNSGGSLKLRTAQGGIASFETNIADLLQEVKCSINPIQDLHGEDKPYPAGGGVNLMEEVFESGFIQPDGTEIENVDSLRSKNYNPCTAGTSIYMYSPNSDNNSLIAFYDNNKTFFDYFRLSPSGRLITIPNGATYFRIALFQYNGGVYDNAVSINYPSTDHDYHPYENICPISGYTEANITRCGVNLWDEEWELGTISTSTGENAPSTTQIRSVNYIPVKPSTTYYNKGYAITVYRYDINKTFLGYSTVQVGTFTLDADTYFIRFWRTATTYNNDISINYPSTDTTYHAYNGQTYTIAFGQTVYGGQLDVTRGKLHVTHKEVDLGDLTWTRNTTDAANPLFYSYISGATIDVANGICSNYPKGASKYSSADKTWTWANYHGNSEINIFDSDYSDAVTFKTAMSGVQFVCQLETPFDIDLTPVQVRALVGENNVFADCGETEVKYLNLE